MNALTIIDTVAPGALTTAEITATMAVQPRSPISTSERASVTDQCRRRQSHAARHSQDGTRPIGAYTCPWPSPVPAAARGRGAGGRAGRRR